MVLLAFQYVLHADVRKLLCIDVLCLMSKTCGCLALRPRILRSGKRSFLEKARKKADKLRARLESLVIQSSFCCLDNWDVLKQFIFEGTWGIQHSALMDLMVILGGHSISGLLRTALFRAAANQPQKTRQVPQKTLDSRLFSTRVPQEALGKRLTKRVPKKEHVSGLSKV